MKEKKKIEQNLNNQKIYEKKLNNNRKVNNNQKVNKNKTKVENKPNNNINQKENDEYNKEDNKRNNNTHKQNEIFNKLKNPILPSLTYTSEVNQFNYQTIIQRLKTENCGLVNIRNNG